MRRTTAPRGAGAGPRSDHAAVALAVLIAAGTVACGAGEKSATPPPVPAGQISQAASSLDAAHAACDSVAAGWRLTARADVRQADSSSHVLADSVPHAGCLVFASVPQGLDSAQRRSLYWTREPSRGWHELTQFMADGPDGGSWTLERGSVRCQVDHEREGDDDADSTHVPSPAVREQTFCWMVRA